MELSNADVYVGTQATVKTQSPEELKPDGFEIILAKTPIIYG